jgi:murein DD-endopeptidase MepM/ murein hydrolase activator NlpD
LQIKKIIIEILIFLAKIVVYTKRLLFAFFIIAYKPIYAIIKFLFYKVAVKGYCFYLSIIKKLGWNIKESNILSYVLNQKTVHILIAAMTLVFVFTNLTKNTKAGMPEDSAKKTIVAQLVKSEFGELQNESEIIEESYGINTAVKTENSYLKDNPALKNSPHALMLNPEDMEANEEISSQVSSGGTALIKREIASTKITKQSRTEIVEYIVEPGDTISTIAAEFEVTVNTVLWENNLSAYSLIKPGQSLKILPVSGLSHAVKKGENLSAIAKKYKIDEEKITEFNKLSENAILTVNKKLIIPGGVKIQAKPAPKTSSYTGISAIKDLITQPSATPVASNKMNWPTVGHRISQYYSWRHLGLDIANKTGTPIYSSDAGIVEFAGWSTGYGNNIIIDHGGGKKTRYAHLLKFYLKKGDSAEKGESIGEMGSTGWSTGPHLHFEIIINGRKYNPLNYIK